MFLLDTNVLSAMRRRDRIDPALASWSRAVYPADLFLSVVTILEIDLGTLLVERRDPRQGAVLRAWIENRVLPTFADRILPVNLPVARRCALLHVPSRRAERDALIAATALVHRLTVATRNVADFRPMGVDLVNPWE